MPRLVRKQLTTLAVKAERAARMARRRRRPLSPGLQQRNQVLALPLQHRSAGPGHGTGLGRAGEPGRGPRARACLSASAARRHRSARAAARSAKDAARLEAAQGDDLRGLRQGLCRGASPGLARRCGTPRPGAPAWRIMLPCWAPCLCSDRSPPCHEGAGADLAAPSRNTAARVRARIERILDWATVRGFRKGDNPARWTGHLDHLLPAQGATVRHHAALPYAEVAGFVAALRERQETSARAFEFLILTAARTGEVLERDLGRARRPALDLDDHRLNG